MYLSPVSYTHLDVYKRQIEISEIWLSANLQAHDFVPDSYWTENLPFVKEMLPQADKM